LPDILTFTIIDPTTGRVMSEQATAAEVNRHASVIAACQGGVVIVKNGSYERRLTALLAVAKQEVAHA
jgi:hypothetical protein